MHNSRAHRGNYRAAASSEYHYMVSFCSAAALQTLCFLKWTVTLSSKLMQLALKFKVHLNKIHIALYLELK